MTEEFRQRSDLLGTQVITRTTGKRLGVVSQLWVDIDSQEVVALSLRPNLFYGTPQPMMLSSIRQIGDVILVDDENAIEDIDLEVYSSLIGCEVITETGELLGKVRGYRFDIDSGKVDTLVIASIGLPLIPDQVVSTFELSIEEVVSSGPDRLIVYEGAEDRMSQMTVGFLERMGIGKSTWEREQQTYLAPVKTENQLPSGQKTAFEPPAYREPIREQEEEWDEDYYEPEPLQSRQPAPQRARPLYNDEDREDWTPAIAKDDYRDEEYDEDFEEDNYVDTEDEALDVEFEPVEAEVTPLPPPIAQADPEVDPWGEDDEDEAIAEPEEPRPELKLEQREKQKELEEESY
jgi:sporulation protein YlmC with PRC-barrel domain